MSVISSYNRAIHFRAILLANLRHVDTCHAITPFAWTFVLRNAVGGRVNIRNLYPPWPAYQLPEGVYLLNRPYDRKWKLIASSVAKLETDWL